MEKQQMNDIKRIMDYDEYNHIIDTLIKKGCKRIKGRREYTLLKEEIEEKNNTQDVREFKTCVQRETEKPASQQGLRGGVNSPYCGAIPQNDTTSLSSVSYNKPFLAPLDVQAVGTVSDVIPSFSVLHSGSLSLNIGFDTEFEYFNDGSVTRRFVISLQMSIKVGSKLVRYFFLVDPLIQEVFAFGGSVPLKYCLSDVLGDLKESLLSSLPLVRNKDILYKETVNKNGSLFRSVDYSAMKDSLIPVTLICHTGKADISVFRRSKYDVDVIRSLAEIQGGWISTEKIRLQASTDCYRNFYWLVDLTVRDTLGLTPANNKSLKALGLTINRPKIELPDDVISNMSRLAVSDPLLFYEYAMNDADIVVSFCSELFRCNHAVPMTLSSAASSSAYHSIKNYLGVSKKSDFDRVFRGLELLDDGIVPHPDECMKFLKATRYVPVRDNPDAKLITEFFEESYTGGFNTSFYIGWITEHTTDYDLQAAYPTSMAAIYDIDWSKPVRDFPRNYVLSLQDLHSPLIPAVAVGDFEFPEDCYCPNIPVSVKGGLKIYPRTGKHVYMSGPDMYLALCLGAKITVYRGFVCQLLQREEGFSKSLGFAVTRLVQDRFMAKRLYPSNPVFEKSLKTMYCSVYGKVSQNVSPKTRYNAKLLDRVDSEPSPISSPYHASYTTALVRCILIASINQLHDLGYVVYSVTTDGFITNAPEDVLTSLDCYGFTNIFQEGRYTLNQTRDDIPENHVWEAKHHNDTFLNITTRGNVAVNEGGVLAHNSYVTGVKEKDSMKDRDAFLVAVLKREGRLKCPTKVWTEFSDIVERKREFKVVNTDRYLSMDFDYKRCPIVETSKDVVVHYDSVESGESIETVIAEFDTRAYNTIEEFLAYRRTVQSSLNSDKKRKKDGGAERDETGMSVIKVKEHLENIAVKASNESKGYVGTDHKRAILLSILKGYRAGVYAIPSLDGLKQKEAVEKVNSWNVASSITVTDWKNCSRKERQETMLETKLVEKMLKVILRKK